MRATRVVYIIDDKTQFAWEVSFDRDSLQMLTQFQQFWKSSSVFNSDISIPDNNAFS